jgi:rubrerythrin
MELTTKEIVKKMILDSQEMVRDYETHSKKVDDMEVAELFKTFAEQCGYQASKLQTILNKIDK